MTIVGDAFDVTRCEYLDWILGTNGYRSARQRRMQAGLRPSWDAATLADGGDFHGDNELLVRVRGRDGELRLVFEHRDESSAERRWHTAARLEAFPGGVHIEHAVGQTWSDASTPRLIAAPPQVLRKLVERYRHAVAPRELAQSGVTHVRGDEAEAFVRHIVLDRNRTLPIVVVSSESATDRPLVDVEAFASCLATVASVVELDDDASYAWGDAFAAARDDRALGRCFDGAVRLYRGPIGASDADAVHYVWHPSRVWGHVERHDGDRRAAARDCAAEVAQQIVRATLPPGFFRLIETFDRQRSAERARAVLAQHEAMREETARHQVVQVVIRKPAAAESPDVARLHQALEAERQQTQSLHASLVESRSECDDYVGQIDALEEDRKRHTALIAELEQERDALRAELARAQRGVDVGADRNRAALRAAFCDREPTLEQALVVLELLVADRVRVLPTAFAAARRSATFKRRGKAWELLWKLATDWWTAMAEGGGDDRARHVFTPEQYAARESQTVEGNRVGRERRTFVVDGAPTTMWRHLKIGVKDSLTETWRCHFEWMPEERRIVIGHCGGHLDFE